jgi:hypothetical protein
VIAGAVVALVFAAIGYAAGRWTRRTAALTPPVCGCGHHKSFHADGGIGTCNQISGDRITTCRCKQYIGPEHVPDFIDSSIDRPGWPKEP